MEFFLSGIFSKVDFFLSGIEVDVMLSSQCSGSVTHSTNHSDPEGRREGKGGGGKREEEERREGKVEVGRGEEGGSVGHVSGLRMIGGGGDGGGGG